MRLLARDLSRLRPDFRITGCVQDCEYHNALGFDSVEDSVGKPRDNCTTHFPVDTREDVRKTLYGVKRGADGRKKLFTKAIMLPVVPRVTTG